jgi:hypothetical protein
MSDTATTAEAADLCFVRFFFLVILNVSSAARLALRKLTKRQDSKAKRKTNVEDKDSEGTHKYLI